MDRAVEVVAKEAVRGTEAVVDTVDAVAARVDVAVAHPVSVGTAADHVPRRRRRRCDDVLSVPSLGCPFTGIAKFL